MLNNTEEIGNSTLIELNNQGEQIKNLNKKSDILYNQLKITKSKLHKILSTLPLTNLLFNNDLNSLNTYNDDLSKLKINNSNLNDISHTIFYNNTTKKYDIDDISAKLNTLKLIAEQINSEIKEQNDYINSLSMNIDKLNNITETNSVILNKV